MREAPPMEDSPFWDAHRIAAVVGQQRDQVYKHRANLEAWEREHKVRDRIRDHFPLCERHARRLIQWIESRKRSKKAST